MLPYCSRLLIFAAMALPAIAPAARGADSSELRRLAEIVKPTAEELRWQQIPWELDPEAALKAAKAAKRPIFFWAAGGRQRDGLPLERC